MKAQSDNRLAPSKNERPFDLETFHTQTLFKTIKEFYSLAKAHTFIEANNILLNSYLEKALDKDECYSLSHVQDIVFTVTYQNQFLTALKERFDLVKRYSSIDIKDL